VKANQLVWLFVTTLLALSVGGCVREDEESEGPSLDRLSADDVLTNAIKVSKAITSIESISTVSIEDRERMSRFKIVTTRVGNTTFVRHSMPRSAYRASEVALGQSFFDGRNTYVRNSEHEPWVKLTSDTAGVGWLDTVLGEATREEDNFTSPIYGFDLGSVLNVELSDKPNPADEDALVHLSGIFAEVTPVLGPLMGVDDGAVVEPPREKIELWISGETFYVHRVEMRTEPGRSGLGPSQYFEISYERFNEAVLPDFQP